MANITTQTIRVDLSTGKIIPTAYTHQNDTARTLVFDMYNGGMPYTMTGNTVKFAYKSPIVNGQYSVIAGASMASGTVSGNKVTVTLPVAYTQISGVGLLTMIITPTNGTVRPVNIRLVVQKSADGDDTVMGASDFPESLYEYMDDWLAENEPTEIADIRSALNALSNQPVFDFVIGKTISPAGNEGNASYGSHTKQIPVTGGDIVFRLTPATDNDGNTLIIHVCQYANGVFKSRTSLTVVSTNNPIALDSDTDSIILNFSRPSSSGITMTQQDIDTYFSVFVYRRASLEVDQYTRLVSFYIGQSEAESEYASLLANVPSNTFIWTNTAWWNDSPENKSNFCYVISLAYRQGRGTMTTQGTQIATFPDNGAICTRRIKSGSWTPWSLSDGSFPTYYAYGDSLTWGAVWDSDQNTSLYQADYNDQIPTRVAHAIGSTQFTNKGVSGARFVPQGSSDTSTIIGDVIKADNLSGVDVVTIGGGRNDSATPLGTAETSTINDGTIIGALIDIFEYLTANYPKLQIVMYGVTPQPTASSHAPEDIYTRVFAGGWSLNTYHEEMRKICAKYGVPFIDWYDCTLILRWGVLSGGYSDGTQNWSHPLSSDTYKQMGNYLGGRIASFYKG